MSDEQKQKLREEYSLLDQREQNHKAEINKLRERKAAIQTEFMTCCPACGERNEAIAQLNAACEKQNPALQ